MISIEYRPLQYQDVVGQHVAKRMLANLVKSNNLPKALVFAGPSGIGKTTLARIFARAVLCSSPAADGSPCNTCRSCVQHIKDAHPLYIEVDAATNSGKESMENLKEKLAYDSDGTMIILLDESQNITKSGKDVLLRMLESTGHNDFMVIFCTTDPSSMPETLSGRSIKIPVRTPTDLEIAARLGTLCSTLRLKADPEALSALASSACGNVRGAEQSLAAVGLLGDITLSNAHEAAVTDLTRISQGICALGRNLADALEIFEDVLSTYGVEAAYRGMLKLLVEAARYGASLERYEALTPAKEIWKLLPKKVPSLLDYIVTRQRFTDPYLFRSDLVVMHTRFLKGEILDFELDTKAESKPGAPAKVKGAVAEQPEDSWSMLESVREKKRIERNNKSSSAEKLGPGLDWGPETTNSKPNTLRRS